MSEITSLILLQQLFNIIFRFLISLASLSSIADGLS
jgi:hypothetical protein